MEKKGKDLRILVIAPHPDDDLIGCGGSMSMHLQRGNEVFVVYVTNGDAECPEYSPSEFTAIRRRETKEAARILGIEKESLFFLNEHPWRLNEERIRFGLLRLIREIKPNACYIPHSEDGHVDHRIVARAALDAINMAPGKWFRQHGSSWSPFPPPIILAYEVWSPLPFPNYLEDITDFLEKKMEALREHRSQNVDKYERAHRGLSAFRGAMHEAGGVAYAEAFHILKLPKLFS